MSIEIASASISPDRDNQSTYTRLDPTPEEQALLDEHPCPVCLDEAELWEYVEVSQKLGRTTIFKHVCCANGEPFGPQLADDTVYSGGCVLNFPPRAFYQPTRHEAIGYWAEYSVALRILRWSNEIKRLSAAYPDNDESVIV